MAVKEPASELRIPSQNVWMMAGNELARLSKKDVVGAQWAGDWLLNEWLSGSEYAFHAMF